MAYARRQSPNAGGSGIASFAYGVDIDGICNAETLKVAGVSVLGGVASLTTYTQTYATASATVANATYVAPTVTGVATTTVTKTNSSPYGFSSGDADAVVTFLGAAPAAILSLNTQLVALAADVLQLKKNVTQLIDDQQNLGFAA